MTAPVECHFEVPVDEIKASMSGEFHCTACGERCRPVFPRWVYPEAHPDPDDLPRPVWRHWDDL